MYMEQFGISSIDEGTDLNNDPIIKDEIAWLATNNVYGAINAYNLANPGRKAISSSVVLPGTSQEFLDRTYPRWHQGGYWVSPVGDRLDTNQQ
jgi:hypothetical protein